MPLFDTQKLPRYAIRYAKDFASRFLRLDGGHHPKDRRTIKAAVIEASARQRASWRASGNGIYLTPGGGGAPSHALPGEGGFRMAHNSMGLRFKRIQFFRWRQFMTQPAIANWREL